jgi:hypothetical protein
MSQGAGEEQEDGSEGDGVDGGDEADVSVVDGIDADAAGDSSEAPAGALVVWAGAAARAAHGDGWCSGAIASLEVGAAPDPQAH